MPIVCSHLEHVAALTAEAMKATAPTINIRLGIIAAITNETDAIAMLINQYGVADATRLAEAAVAVDHAMLNLFRVAHELNRNTPETDPCPE